MSNPAFLSVASWQYIDINAPVRLAEVVVAQVPAELPIEGTRFTEAEVEARVRSALEEAQQLWDQQARKEQQRRDATLSSALNKFAIERSAYFKKVESEVVQLSLAVARKILQREAELDSTLLSGLVRIALDRIGAEPPIRIRVASSALGDWERAWLDTPLEGQFSVVADDNLGKDDCYVETSAGTANISIEAQLKEVEQSFIDLLARRPEAP